MKKIISIPNASRTFDALRSLGYDLNSSIADIIDNSITEKVNSSEVSVTFQKRDKNFKVRIWDNGIGMNSNQLEEAMRIGAQSTYKKGDLGKLGMGMKTASLSHCNVLTVISKRKHDNIVGFKWDINLVKQNDEGWILFELTQEEIQAVLSHEKIQLDNHGTLVLWDDLFLIDEEYSLSKNEKLALNYFYKTEEDLKLYLSLVFHRFLEKKTLSIKVNHDKLFPWDPFWRKEKNTQEIPLSKALSEIKIKQSLPGILIKGYILPNRESFSNEDNWKEAKGLLSWNDAQGYYIYRADRIIRFGGWQGTRAKDEHDKLARLSIDIDSSLDQFFRITVNKSQVQFPDILFSHLKLTVNPVVSKAAQLRYRNSRENPKFKNKFRGQEKKLGTLSKSFIKANGIKTKQSQNTNEIVVTNPNGRWLANQIGEFIKYGSNKDFEVISGKIEDGHLWKIVCNLNEKMKVVVNESHPFYKRIYSKSTNKNITNAVDAFIFSLAFAELYNRNNQNEDLFDAFKTICSEVLEAVTNNEII